MFVAQLPAAAVRFQLADQAMRAQHPGRLVEVGVVGADHAAFDRAQVVGVVEGEVGRQADRAEHEA